MKVKEPSTSLNSEFRENETEFYFTSTEGAFEYTSASNRPERNAPSRSESENLILAYLKVIVSRQDTMWSVLRSLFRGMNSRVRVFLPKLRIVAHKYLSERVCNFLFANLGAAKPMEEPCKEFPPLPPPAVESHPEELPFSDDAGKSTYLYLRGVLCLAIDESVFDDFVRHLIVCKYESAVYHCIVYYLHVYPRLCELDSWEDVRFQKQLCSLLKEKKGVFNYKNLQRRILRNRYP